VNLTEFELVERFFAHGPVARADVVLGIGDDAAILRPRPGQDVVTALHTMSGNIEAVPARDDPGFQAHTALAVPLSHLAAAGAEPAWASLALTLPSADAAWLTKFSQSLMALAQRFKLQLTGGDSCRGPFAATVLASGLVPSGQILRRQGACPGDLLLVTGTFGRTPPGAPGAGDDLNLSAAEPMPPPARHLRSEPRVAEGVALRGLASAVTDLPAGLHSAIESVLEASGVGAKLAVPGIANEAQLDAQLSHGGRGCYELCFALPPARESELAKRFCLLGTRYTRIGMVEQSAGLRYEAGDDPPQ
jgi:thiamine-monophosphate kinase